MSREGTSKDAEETRSDSRRTLVLVRHAAAHGHSPKGDHARPLTEAGREDARRVGRWLAAQGLRADAVLVSTALRARQTAQELTRGGLEVEQSWEERRIYNAHVDEIVACIRDVPDDVTTLVVVGHAPGIPGLAASAHDPDGLTGSLGGWPTTGVGILGVAGSWCAFPDGSALLALHHPFD